MGELGETIEAVFPYPYRFLWALCSGRYRATLRKLYAANGWGWRLTDALVSGFFLVTEILLLVAALSALVKALA